MGVEVGVTGCRGGVIQGCVCLCCQEADNDPTGEAAQIAQQLLTFYELDLGLNHVVRKYSEPLEDTANMLVSVPGGSDGPSGVLVCCENYLIYKNFGDQPDLRCPIPRRQHDLDDAERSMLFVCSATHRTKVGVDSGCGQSYRIMMWIMIAAYVLLSPANGTRRYLQGHSGH